MGVQHSITPGHLATLQVWCLSAIPEIQPPGHVSWKGLQGRLIHLGFLRYS